MAGKLKIAVVGCGYWGPNLVRNFASMEGVELASICDQDQRRLDELFRRYRISKQTTRIEDILEDPDINAVALATPVSTHRPLGERILQAQKHLWVEKPLASTSRDASALVTLAKERDLCLFVDHTFVYEPAVRKARELVSSGELGEVLYFDSVRVNLGLFQADANVCWDLGPHDLSIADYVLERQPNELLAVGVRHIRGAPENLVYLTLKYDSNLMAHFHFNWLAPVKVRKTMIGGTRRMIVYDDLEPVEKIKVFDKGVTPSETADMDTRRQTLVSYRSGDMSSPKLELREPLSLAAIDFVDAIRSHRAPAANGAMGLRVVQILEAAQESIERGGMFVKIPKH